MKKFLIMFCFAVSFVCLLALTACDRPVTENEIGKIQPEVGEQTDKTTDEQPEAGETSDPVDDPAPVEESDVPEQPEPVPEPEPEVIEEPRLEATPISIVDEEINWNADYNKPKVDLEEIVPGLVAQNVYVGEDGWFFYGDTIPDYTGERSFSANRLKSMATKMRQRLEWFEEQGIKMYFVVVPNKNTVYPEYMATEGINMAEERAIDQVVDYIRENTAVTVIDCREGLAAAKAERPDEDLYYRLDTHWNNHGGFAAYTQIMDVIQKDFPLAVKYTREDYQIDYFDSYFKDEAYYLGWYDTLKNDGPVYTLKNGMTAEMTYRKDSGPYGQFIHAYVHEDGYRDKTDYCCFKNEHIPGAPSLYMIRDSFAIALLPFFKDSFSETTFSWTLGVRKSDIEEKQPDIVILEVVERSLSDFFNQSTFN